MERELQALLVEAETRELGGAEFSAKLESIHRARLGAAADLPEYVHRRNEARELYEEITGTIERHHQFERLAETLGIDPDRGGLVADGY